MSSTTVDGISPGDRLAWPDSAAGSVPLPSVAPVSQILPDGGGGAVAPFQPVQLRHFYGVDGISIASGSANGTGQTIAIIVAYNDPRIAADLVSFDNNFGLQAPPSFKIVNETGGSALPGGFEADWARETAIDVEWAHAFAPGANLLLVEANAPTYDDLVTQGVATANATPGVSVVSMSFSGPDFAGENSLDAVFNQPGVTYLSATGDGGAASTGYPATSPNVVAVGGTQITTGDGNASYGSEAVWNDNSGATGGAISTNESKPAYQSAITQSANHRTVPDVSFDASFNSGVQVLDTSNGDPVGAAVAGGTSLGTPCWAGLIAVANQGRAAAGLPSLTGLSQTLPRLYSLPSADYHDVVTGNNNSNPAGPGYDLATGFGTPVANLLIPDLIGSEANLVGGRVFSDNNANGVFNGNEPGVAGATVYLDTNNDGVHQSNEPMATTDASGLYSFAGIATGSTGTVRLSSVPNGFVPVTTNTTYTASATPAASVNLAVFPVTYADATAGDAYTLRASPTSATQLQILINRAVAYTAPTSLVSSLTFTFTGTADSLAIDFGNGSPVPPGGISFNGSSATNGDTLSILGTSGNDSIAVNALGAAVWNATVNAATFSSGVLSFSNAANVIVDPRGGVDSLAVNGGNVTIPAANAGGGYLSRTFSNLNVASGAKVTFARAASPSDRTVVQTSALSIAGTGRLDLGGNDMIVTGSTLSAVNTLVASGYQYGTWTGAGIDSSTAAADATRVSALGIIQNNQSGSPLFSSTNLFDGIAPAAGAVLIKSTYYGDANLDGKVDGSDYSKIDAGYGTRTGWFNGDFNYDGVVDGSDYSLIDNGFNNQRKAIPAAVPAAIVAYVHPVAHAAKRSASGLRKHLVR